MLVMVAFGLLVLAPGLAWALGEDAAGRWILNANPPADQALAKSEEQFATAGIGLMTAPRQFARTFGSDSMDSQASNAAQTSSTNDPDPDPAAVEKERLKINPVTGLPAASESNYSPLTGSERWKLYFKMNYWSVGAYFGPVFSALVLDQSTGSPREWGGGFAGFGRRLASRVGNAVLQGSFQAPVAAVLHEDVRYISSSQHGFKRRAEHAVLYSFLTYNTEGRPTLNIANLSAYYASTAMSSAWLPGHHIMGGYTFSNASEQIALSVPVNLLQEFWPEVRHYVLRRH
jgi:hypothetical protein